jgi:hypothetical protein
VRDPPPNLNEGNFKHHRFFERSTYHFGGVGLSKSWCNVFLVFVRSASRVRGDGRSELECGCGRGKRKLRSLERLYGVEATIFDLGGKADALSLFQA